MAEAQALSTTEALARDLEQYAHVLSLGPLTDHDGTKVNRLLGAAQRLRYYERSDERLARANASLSERLGNEVTKRFRAERALREATDG